MSNMTDITKTIEPFERAVYEAASEDTRKKLPSDLLSKARQKARELGVVLK